MRLHFFNSEVIAYSKMGYYSRSAFAFYHLISNSSSGIIVLLRTPTKYREFSPTLFVNTNDFQLVFNFEQTRTVTIIIWWAWYNGSYTMMANPIRALELHYPMIKVWIISNKKAIASANSPTVQLETLPTQPYANKLASSTTLLEIKGQ